MFQETSSESKSGKKLDNHEATRLIDLQIANLRESIRMLNCQRNGLLPISKLPVEMLTKIFLLHQQNTTDRYTIQKLDWIGITHVSRQWREIALNFSGLWIHIPFKHPKWATEMIARSRHACPIVKATYNPSRYPSEARLLKSFLQQHLSRIQFLEILYLPHQPVGKLFQDIQPTSVPCLSTLRLIELEEPGTASSAVLDSLQIVDDQLLNTCSLRKLRASSSTALRWDFKLFSGLTYLSLDGDYRRSARSQASHRDFLDALRRMPTLQFLHLNGPVLPEAVDRSLLESVYLPDLRDLSVFDTAVSTIEFFLHHVAFPPTTRTEIGLEHLDPVLQPANISPVLVTLRRLLSERPRTLKLYHIEFTCSEDCEWDMIDLRFKAWVSSSPSSLEGYNSNFPSDDPDFTFSVQWNLEEGDLPPEMDEFIVSMFGIFPQDDVISFSLSSYQPDTDDIFFIPLAHKIGQLPALKALYLNYISFAPLLLKAVCDVPKKAEDPSTIACPTLRYLDFTKCKIDVHDLMTLYKLLNKRSELGLGPENLKVDLRGLGLGRIDKKAAALLEKVVEVEWMMDDSDSDDSSSDANSD